MGTDAPCPLGPPLRVTVGTRAREVGCVLPGPGKRRVVSIRLGRLGAPMEPSAHRPGDPVPVRGDALLNNFDGDSVEHLSVPCVDGLASLDGSGASWAPRGSATQRRYGFTASRHSPLPQARHSTARYLEASPVVPGRAGCSRGVSRGVASARCWCVARWTPSTPFGSRRVRQLVSRVRTWSSAMSRASSMGRALRAL
jgi:hypothetical protein